MGTERITQVGFVSIGRNEGERLKLGLRAIQRLCPGSPVVYVDSGSTDESVAFARSLGMDVVELDMSVPFTAARARNAGYQRLREAHPELDLVQFLDGDCELLPGWMETATGALDDDPSLAVVSGRRCERHPEASIFNALMDIEWDTPIGETLAVLGDMCVRVAAFQAVGGFNEQVIAAEDDDLCLRIRAAGYRIERLDARMTLHDANITTLSQWYRRAKRGGHGYAQVHHLHGKGPDRYFRRQLLSAAVWGGAVPAAAALGLVTTPALAVPPAGLYGAIVSKTALWRLRQGDSPRIAAAYALLVTTGKVPELLGALEFYKNHLLARKHVLIEYK